MIEVSGLSKRYGKVTALEDVTFEVERGEIIGFLGPNGAGKTTTMRILTGFSPPSSGTAIVGGYDITTDPMKVKCRVGYLPESVPLYTEMIVKRFLRYVSEVKGVPRGQRIKEAERVMERCGLEDMAWRIIGNLSKGYRQRVGLAQALIGNPPVLILDEPTVGLDPKQIIEIRQMIKALAEDHTVLLSTHILPEVAMICQRVIIIHRGKLVAKDAMADLSGKDAVQIDADIRGEPRQVVRTLQAINGVVDVEDLGSGRYLLRVKRGDDTFFALSKHLAGAGFAVGRMAERERTLEEVFMESISTEEESGP